MSIASTRLPDVDTIVPFERAYSQMIYWNRPEKGGHFAAFEQPATFMNELRTAFASVR